MMCGMRRTLTLDSDVAARLRQEIRRRGKGLKTVVNDALRRGLGMGGRRSAPPPFKVVPHAFGFKPGRDLDRLNQVVDELEAGETAGKLCRTSTSSSMHAMLNRPCTSAAVTDGPARDTRPAGRLIR